MQPRPRRSRVSDVETRGGAACGSRCWASRRPGRTPPGRAAAIWSRRATSALLLDCGNGVFSKLRAVCDYVDVDAVLDHPPARRPFPRSGAVQLRAELRAAPAAGAGRRLAGHRRSGPAAAVRPAGGAEVLRRIVGCWGNEDLIETRLRRARVRRPATSWRWGRCTVRFCEVPHFTATFAVELASNGARVHLQRRLPPQRGAGRSSPADTDVLLIEATLPAARAHWHARPPDPARGRRARPAGRRAPARAHPLLRRARPGPPERRRRRLRRPGRAGPRAPSTV